MILIIGGTAAYDLDLEVELGALERVDCDTPYGQAFPIFVLKENPSLAFASRHGIHQLDVSPPFVNARANIWAAHSLGVQAIVSWNGVGAINPLLEVDDMLVLDEVLDCTKTRIRSFQAARWATTTTTSVPTSWITATNDTPQALAVFDAELSTRLYQAARAQSERTFPIGTYVCTEGPRLETAAEIQAFRRMGADVVGMTLIPEVLLARELGIRYASLAYVTNYATGLEAVGTSPRHFGVEVARRCLDRVRAAVTIGENV